MFRLFFVHGVAECARSLAEEIARRYPSAIANSPEPMVSERRVSEILESVFEQSHRFSRGQRLGVVGQIRLGRALKWQLRELGYNENFVDMAGRYLAAGVQSRPG